MISPERTERRPLGNLEAYIEFPKSRGILWDRSARSHPRFLRSKDVLPSLLIGPGSVRSFLAQLQERGAGDTDVKTLEKVVTISHVSELYEDDLKALKQRSLKTALLPNYVLELCDGSKDERGKTPKEKDLCLTIPISIRDLDEVQRPFDPKGTAQLIRNLGKTIRGSREFSIRSCVRVRATGCVSRGGDGGLSGSLRFEAIVPDVTFQLVAVNPLPVLSTPLSLSLCRKAHSAGPKMGFLTLNQMRKAVPLLETDPALPMVPVVGVWVTVPPGQSIEHPLVWGALLRFLGSDMVKERVWVAPHTFLLAVFGGGDSGNSRSDGSTSASASGPNFYEVAWVQPPLPGACVPLALTRLDEFIVLDFSMDISVQGDDSWSCPAALGCFRQLTRTDHLSSLRETAEILQPGSTAAAATAATAAARVQGRPSPPSTVARSHELLPHARRACGDNAASLANRFAVASSWSPVMEGATPVPRVTIPLPSEPLGEASSKHVDVHSSRTEMDAVTLKSTNSNSNSAQSSTYPSANVGTGVPSEIVLAQQMQIDALRKEVEELRRIVLAIGSAGGAGSAPGAVDALNTAEAPSESSSGLGNAMGGPRLNAPTLSAEPAEMSTCLSARSACSFSMQLSDDTGAVVFRKGTDLNDEAVSELETSASSVVPVAGHEQGSIIYLEPPSIPNIDELSGRFLSSSGNVDDGLNFDDGDDEKSDIPMPHQGQTGLSASLEAFMPSMVLPASISVDLRSDVRPGSQIEEESESILAIQAKYS